jgi:hypothetical protein
MADEKRIPEAGDSIIAEEKVDDTDNTEDYGGFDPGDAVVKLAIPHGWKPKNEYSGDPDKWVPPDEFIENQWKINRATENGKKNLELQLSQLTRKLDNVTQQWEELSKREQAKIHSEIKEQRKQAIEEGDVAKVEALDEKLGELKERSKPDQSNPDAPPEIIDWMERNTWYKPGGQGAEGGLSKIISVTENLNGLYGDKDSPHFIPSIDIRLSRIDREIADYVMMYCPELADKYEFVGVKPLRVNGRAAPKEEEQAEATHRKQIGDVEGNVRGNSSGNKGKTYSSLSMEEKAMCDSTCFANPKMTREKWLAEYNKLLTNG